MKKSILFRLIFLLFCLPQIAFGQLTRGCFMADGTASFAWFERKGTAISNGDSGFSGSFSPSISYFLVDRLAVGASFQTGFTKTDNWKGSNVAAGPLLRYYFNDSRPVAFFAEANARYGRANQEFNTGAGTDRTQYSFRSFGAGVGMNYFFNQNIALELTLAWRNDDSSLDYILEENTIRFGAGFAMFFGGKKAVATENQN